MPEILLAIDTSTPAGSVAVTCGEQVLGELSLKGEGTHTDYLLPSIKCLLKALSLAIADLDALAVVLGPGSFTGLRVGMATAKGLALAAGIPVIGVSSLQTLACQVPFPRYPVCALLDARKKEVYAGLFQWDAGKPVALGAEVVVPPERLLEQLDGDTLFVGNGASAYRTMIVRHLGARAHFAPLVLESPRAACAATLALESFRSGETVPLANLVPYYIRASEAEILWHKRQGSGTIRG